MVLWCVSCYTYFCFINVSHWFLLIFPEAELAVLVLLFLAVLYDLTLFVGVSLHRSSVKLTASQKKMLGIKNNGA